MSALDHSTIRMELLAEDAPLLEAIMSGGAFGGAQHSAWRCAHQAL